jgi:hypothetical protein
MTAAVDNAVYVFALMAATEAEVVDGWEDLDVVRAGPIAAVVAPASTARPLGLASDMRRHDQVVSDLVALGVTVVPMRFGAVVGAADDLVRDLLAPNSASLEQALGELAGLVQYTVRVTYVREAVLSAVIRTDEQVAAARSKASGHAGQLRLGELVVGAIDRRRPGDAARIRAEVEPLAERLVEDLSNDPDRVVDFACLVQRASATQFERAIEEVAARYADAVTIRLLGPLAPYDFVPEL